MKKITIKDIAIALNLSISTVSKALNDSYEISIKTKQLVIEFAKKSNYKPNILARNLKTGKTSTIGVIIASINNPFFSQVLEGIQNYANEIGYDVIFMQSQDQSELERSCIETLKLRGVDGILISPVHETSNLDLLNSLLDQNIPIVIFDRIQHQLSTMKVGVDNMKGAYLATKHLIKLGKTKIINITGSKFGLSQERFKGYKKALEESGISFNPAYYIQCNLQSHSQLDEDLKLSLEKILKSNDMPNAILSSSDTITIRVLAILQELDFQVPNDIAVIGFSNIDHPKSLNPSLSTIRQPSFEIGKQSLEKLIFLLTHRNWKNFDPEIIELDTILTFRKSSGFVEN